MSTLLDAILPPGHAPRVVVLGDLILDEYLRGRVRRISPEAPVPVIEQRSTDLALGGAANVANNLAALGCRVSVCGVVGADRWGEQLLELLASRGIGTEAVRVVHDRPTTHKLRIVAQGQHVVRIDRETAEPLVQRDAEALRDAVLPLVAASDGVIVSDYLKGVLGPTLTREVIDSARAAGVRVAVDPKGANYERYAGVDVLTPNKAELHQATGIPIASDASLLEAARRVLETTGARAVLATCGSDGMVLVERSGRSSKIPAVGREVYDVTGAGDTVIAVFSLGLFNDQDLRAAARIANTAAGIVVAKLGTATVEREEIERALLGRVTASTKLVERRHIGELAASLRAMGRRVVFTNGCFDLLHAGHVTYLEAARELGDALIVGLNSDASVAALKGPGRPLQPVSERAAVLAALESVTSVVVFDETTPLELIRTVRPDVLVKGADYKAAEVVGRDVVLAYGGRVELIPLTGGVSTSTIIGRTVARYGTARREAGARTRKGTSSQRASNKRRARRGSRRPKTPR